MPIFIFNINFLREMMLYFIIQKLLTVSGNWYCYLQKFSLCYLSPWNKWLSSYLVTHCSSEEVDRSTGMPSSLWSLKDSGWQRTCHLQYVASKVTWGLISMSFQQYCKRKESMGSVMNQNWEWSLSFVLTFNWLKLSYRPHPSKREIWNS